MSNMTHRHSSKGIVRIAIVDDHPIVRRGLREILEEDERYSVVGEAANAAEAIALVRQLRPDILLLDVTMPGRSGLDVLHQIVSEELPTRVLVLSIHPENQYALRAIKAGARGYLTKESAPDELLVALEKILAGGCYLTESVAHQMTQQATRKATKATYPHELLSDREFEVLRLLGSGKSVTEIAEELNLSVKTVSTYRARIMEKLQAKHTPELIRYAMEHGLVSK